jgi:hypothetical protein
MSSWSDSIVESMSTADLCVALRSADAEGIAKPSPRLMERMQEEWDDRPALDRVAAEAQIDRSFG